MNGWQYQCVISNSKGSVTSDAVTLTVKQILLAKPANPQWDSATPGRAAWGAVTNASGYSVQLYKDGVTEGAAVSVNGTDYAFAIAEAGSYTFKVKAMGGGNYTDSEETESGSSAFHAVTFDTNGGGTIAPQIIVHDGKSTVPEAPAKTGHTFAGWYSDSGFSESSKWDFKNNAVSQNITLYAKWEVNTYTVTLNAGGGTISNGNVTSYTYGTETTLPTADDITYTGHVFKGWYEDSSFSGSPVTAIAATDMGDKAYYAKWLSTDTGVTAVSVDSTAGTIDGTSITVVLPYRKTLPTESSKVSITPAAGAAVSALATADDGATWTFTVTAEDGTAAENYTINISIAENPAAGNIADVAAAKSTIQSAGWTVAQSTANTEAAVKSWIESQLKDMNLNGVGCTVSISGFTAAAAGNRADMDGTDGSFAFTVSLSKGVGSTLAVDTVMGMSGTISATPYQIQSYTISVSASPTEGGTVIGGGTYTENDSVTVTASAKDGYH